MIEQDVVKPKVVSLDSMRPKAALQVFTCECGGQQYFLLSNGAVQCAMCQNIHQNTKWEAGT